MSEDNRISALVPIVIEIVSKALPHNGIGPDDDLFDLGLTSIGFVRVIAELNGRYGTSLNGSELGDTASVRSIAAAITHASTVTA